MRELRYGLRPNFSYMYNVNYGLKSSLRPNRRHEVKFGLELRFRPNFSFRLLFHLRLQS